MSDSFHAFGRAVRAAAPSAQSLVFVGVLAALLALGAPEGSLAAAPLRLLVASTVNFSSDGGHYVAWETQAGSPITVLNTRSGLRRQITLPAGCQLGNDYVNPGATPSAAAGRFILSCVALERNYVLDVRTGTSVPLAAGASWFELGTRYAQGNSSSEHQVVQSLASGAVKRSGEPGTVDLDRPGAPGLAAVCARLRRAVSRTAGFEGSVTYRNGVFVQPLGERGAVSIERCSGARTVLRGASPGGSFERHQPRYFDLRAGLLTWDSGEPPQAENAELGERRFRSRLYSYVLASGRRRSWMLPQLRIRNGSQTYPPAAAGYSTHTADAVFWIASRTVPPGNPDGAVSTASVYSARL
jgi:hypothetical protein